MSVQFYLSNDRVYVNKHNDDVVISALPNKVYKVSHDDMLGFFLTHLQDSFVVPSKMYGSTNQRINKILTTYQSRNSQMGVLLTGSKGTGKTILTEALCNQALNLGLPVIIISAPYSGSDFFSFMSNLGECVVLFDEFGKVYKDNSKEKQQESLLSFLDGTYSTKRLLLFTENEQMLINEFLLNRPGRVFYHFKYERVEDEVITEYCTDHSIPQEQVTELLSVADHVEGFSFDMLKAIVDEYLRYKEPINDILIDMNIDLTAVSTILRIQSITKNEKTLYPDSYSIPVNKHGSFSLEVYDTPKKESDECYYFSQNINNTKHKKGNMVYIEDGDMLIVASVEKVKFNYRAF